MTDKKEKEQRKKSTPGMAATAHRLETSHAVLSELKEVGSNPGAHPVSLASASVASLALLKVVQVRSLTGFAKNVSNSLHPDLR